MKRRLVIGFVLLSAAACSSTPDAVAPSISTVQGAQEFATVYNAVLDATERRYPTYHEDARIGRVATAWHLYRSVYTDPVVHHGAWFGRWRPPVESPGLFVRMRVHVVGGQGNWRIVIYPQAAERSIGKSPHRIAGVPGWLAREAELFRRQIVAAIAARTARRGDGAS